MESKVRTEALEYARFHGLTRDYRSVHPLDNFRDEIAAAGVEEKVPGLFEFDQVNWEPFQERLTLTKESASLLASVLKTRDRESINFDELLPDYRRKERLKVEQPLLSTDHDMDMDDFKRRRIVPDLENMDIPYEELDDELDEGMGWPSSYEAARQQAIKNSENEKLVFPKEVWQYLSKVLKPPPPDCKDRVIREEEEKLMQRQIPKPITPPLLPMSPPTLPFVPPPEACQFELLSEHTSPTREILKMFDARLMKADSIKRKRDRDLDNASSSSEIKHPGDVYSPLKGIENTPPLPLVERQRPQKLEVEVPLPPRSPTDPPSREEKVASFPESLLEINPDLPTVLEKPEGEVSSDNNNSFAKPIVPVAAAKRSAEQEQLEKADPMSKVKVPPMDFTRPVAPWDLASSAPKGSTKDTRTRDFLKDTMEKYFEGETWHYSAKEERSLRWAPFPAHLARARVQETIDIEEDELNTWIAQPPCMDVNTLIGKTGGLRLNQADGSDEEKIEPGDYPPSNDFAVPLKRKAIEMGDKDHAALSKTSHGHKPIHAKKPRIDPVATKECASTKELGTHSHDRYIELDNSRPTTRGTLDTTAKHAKSDTLGQSFSTFTSIGNYMSLRTGQPKARVVSESSFFKPKKPVPSDGSSSQRPTPRHQELAEYRAPQASSHAVPFPTPAIQLPLEPRHFMASASSLINKKVWRRIYALYPDACIIERDFSHLPTESASNSNPIFNDEKLLAYEVDIALSPSAGLIWTTLQKIKQKSLPGQVASSPIRERIVHTANRYEHLIIIISQGCSPNEPLPYTDSDATALATLTSFCACLPSNPELVFVPGYDLELAQWTVHLMIKHSTGVPNFELQEEETLWEVWLRRAGMNAFAAQYVLSQMQAPVLSREDMMLDKYRGEFGLAAFVAMGAREREETFAEVVGREVLRRVERNVRGRWGKQAG